jgi:hypothetical protein
MKSKTLMVTALGLLVAGAASAGVPIVKDKEKATQIVRFTGAGAGAAVDWFTVPDGFMLVLTDLHVTANEQDTFFSVHEAGFTEPIVDARVPANTTHTSNFHVGPVFGSGSQMQVQAVSAGAGSVRWHVGGYLAKEK